ncbi:hypothetical protein SAMN05428979_3949 [Stappia sp. ES.058]|nr:hypothetical protein SAMN05428979_3949 [Stappia sp. ES.058]
MSGAKLQVRTASAQFSGITLRNLCSGDDAPVSPMEKTVEAGMGAPAHISFHEDKNFHASRGRNLFPVGELWIEAAPGAPANRVSAMKSTKTRSFGEICRLDGQ